MVMLEGRNLAFSYGEKELFSQVNIELNAGECIAICGQSGCGKTSLCYILAGIIPRSVSGTLTGEVLLCGEHMGELSLKDVASRIGVVFQNPDSQLFAPTVEDELAFAPENLCVPRAEIGARIDRALALVGMEKHRYSSPSCLSGGQKQLIALAATLTAEPDILIFDEALSQLDYASTERIKDCIKSLKNEGRALLMVEHDEENLDIADRIYRFKNGSLVEE